MNTLTFTATNFESSLIKGIDYCNSILTVELKGNRLYSYNKVSVKVAIALLTAESVGRYYNDFIKDCYEYELLDYVA